MKLKNKSLSVAVALLASAAVASCSIDYDPIDTYSDVTIPPTDEESGEEVRFKTKSDVDSYIAALDKKFSDRQEHWYLDRLLIAEAHTDNAYAGTTGAEVVPYEDNSIEGSNTVVARDWDRFLEDVAYANVLIDNVYKVPDGSVSAAEADTYAAQARIFRAMIWFDMTRLWGDVPIIKTVAGDITADNIEEVYGDYFPKQNTEVEAYAAIVEDLEFGLAHAPSNSGDKSKLTREVAMAMLAKTFAEKPVRDYNKVIQYADQLAAAGYDMVDDLNDLWGLNDAGDDCAARNTKETIYEAHFYAGAGSWVTWMYGRDELDWNSNFTWAKWITPSRDLINLFNAQGDTKRYEQSVVWRECTWSNYYPANNYAFMYKCRSNLNNIIKLRYTDILLLKAEAMIMGESQNLEGAAQIIDRVRDRAGLPKLTSAQRGSKEALLQSYLDERRMELCFEGERWFDLVRLNKVEEVMNAVYAKDPGRHAQRNLFSVFSYRLPIPQSAIDKNDNLQQNPGY